MSTFGSFKNSHCPNRFQPAVYHPMTSLYSCDQRAQRSATFPYEYSSISYLYSPTSRIITYIPYHYSFRGDSFFHFLCSFLSNCLTFCVLGLSFSWIWNSFALSTNKMAWSTNHNCSISLISIPVLVSPYSVEISTRSAFNIADLQMIVRCLDGIRIILNFLPKNHYLCCVIFVHCTGRR